MDLFGEDKGEIYDHLRGVGRIKPDFLGSAQPEARGTDTSGMWKIPAMYQFCTVISA